MPALVRHRDHVGSGDGDEGELDVTRDFGDRRVRGDALDDGSLRVHRVDHAAEGLRDQVPEESATDRFRVSRGADHGAGTWLQEGAHRVRRRGTLTFLVLLQRPFGDRGGELDLDLTRLGADGGHEARIAEHADHPMVLGQDLRRERGDPGPAGGLGQYAEEDRTHPVTLELVRHRDRDLGTVGRADPDVLGAAHHPLAVAVDHADQGEVVHLIHIDGPSRLLADVDRVGPEAQPARFFGQAEEVVLQQALVVAGGRPDVDRGAIAQDDVGLEVCRIRRVAHAAILRGRPGQPDWSGRSRIQTYSLGCPALKAASPSASVRLNPAAR